MIYEKCYTYGLLSIISHNFHGLFKRRANLCIKSTIIIGVKKTLLKGTSLQNFSSSRTMTPFGASMLMMLNVASCASCARADSINWAV